MFYAHAAVTWNALSPIVRSRVRSMISHWREPERRRCSASALSVQRRSLARYGLVIWYLHSTIVPHIPHMPRKSKSRSWD